jgi:hypothetical protein
MTDLQLLSEFSSLPKELKEEVADFIKRLKNTKKDSKPVRQRQFGAAKGFFVMHKDFDEPLEDFKEYT